MSHYTMSQSVYDAYQSHVRNLEDSLAMLRKLPVYSTGSAGAVAGVTTTPFEMAGRYIGVREIPGKLNSGVIMGMLQLDQSWPQNDETPWCSAFVNLMCFNLGLERSKSLMARSWLNVGLSLHEKDLQAGFDIVIFKQSDSAPGADVLSAPGHVGFYAGPYESDPSKLVILGGNQGDSVSMGTYPKSRVLGYRRLGVV